MSALAFTPLAHAAKTSCKAQLSLLDAAFKATLNETADLLVTLRNLEEGDAYTVALKAQVQSKLQALNDLISDPQMRTEASNYLHEKTNEVDNTNQANVRREADQEVKSRKKESHLLSRYKAVNSGQCSIQNDIYRTEFIDGDMITIKNPTNYFDEDFNYQYWVDIKKFSSIYMGSAKLQMAEFSPNRHTNISNGIISETKYLPKTKKFYFTTPLGIYSFDAREVIAGKEGAKARAVIKNDYKTREAIRALFDPSTYAYQASPDRFFSKSKTTSKGEIIALTDDRDIIVYNVRQKTFTALKIPKRRLIRLGDPNWALSPDGKYIVVGSNDTDDKKVSLYSTSTGKLLKSFPYRTSTVAFSNDGQWLAVNNLAGFKHSLKNLVVLKIFGKSQIRYMDGLNRAPIFATHILFSPDDKKLFVANQDEVQVGDVETGQRLQTLKAKDVFKISFSEDGDDSFATIGYDNQTPNQDFKVWRRVEK